MDEASDVAYSVSEKGFNYIVNVHSTESVLPVTKNRIYMSHTFGTHVHVSTFLTCNVRISLCCHVANIWSCC